MRGGGGWELGPDRQARRESMGDWWHVRREFVLHHRAIVSCVRCAGGIGRGAATKFDLIAATAVYPLLVSTPT